jgi:hypothetical protein
MMAPDVPELVVRPPARCFHKPADHPGRPCGRRATWMRCSKHGAENQFFCDVHKRSTDVLIPADALFRRVTVTLDVELAAADLTPNAAHTEAVARVLELVEQLAGLPNIHRVTSVVGRPARQAPAGQARRVGVRV